MTALVLYLSLLALGAAFILARREPTLLRGERFFALTAVCAAAYLGAVVAAGGRPSRKALAFWGVCLACSLWARTKLFLFRADRANASEAIERSLRMLLIVAKNDRRGYRLKLSGGPVFVDVSPRLPGGVILAFGGSGRHKKVRLLRSLLAKVWRPVFPRIQIDLR